MAHASLHPRRRPPPPLPAATHIEAQRHLYALPRTQNPLTPSRARCIVVSHSAAANRCRAPNSMSPHPPCVAHTEATTTLPDATSMAAPASQPRNRLQAQQRTPGTNECDGGKPHSCHACMQSGPARSCWHTHARATHPSTQQPSAESPAATARQTGTASRAQPFAHPITPPACPGAESVCCNLTRQHACVQPPKAVMHPPNPSATPPGGPAAPSVC